MLQCESNGIFLSGDNVFEDLSVNVSDWSVVQQCIIVESWFNRNCFERF